MVRHRLFSNPFTMLPSHQVLPLGLSRLSGQTGQGLTFLNLQRRLHQSHRTEEPHPCPAGRPQQCHLGKGRRISEVFLWGRPQPNQKSDLDNLERKAPQEIKRGR